MSSLVGVRLRCGMSPMEIVVCKSEFKSIGLMPGSEVLFLGEIENFPGFCAVSLSDGRIWWNCRTEYFRPMTEEEILEYEL